MGTIRVTQRILVDRVLDNINFQSRRILELQDQLATGLRVNRPSDDPIDARRAIDARTEISNNEQFLRNISSVNPLLVETETAILSVVDNLRRARELTLQGISDTNAEQREAIALEVNQILELSLQQGNLFSNGRFIFGGTRTLNTPFEVPTRTAEGEVSAVDGVVYAGNDEHFQVEVSQGILVNANETGADVFTQTGADTVDVFQTLIDIREALRNDDTATLEGALTALGQAEDQLLLATARTGSLQARLDRIDADLRTVGTQLEQVLSDSIDADFAEVILELNAQSNAFQAALDAGGRVLQPSLLQFVQ